MVALIFFGGNSRKQSSSQHHCWGGGELSKHIRFIICESTTVRVLFNVSMTAVTNIDFTRFVFHINNKKKNIISSFRFIFLILIWTS